MFGFLFGTVCLGGLFALLFGHGRGLRRGRHCRRGRFGRFGLNAALEHLDTTPGQEKAILAALDELRDGAAEVKRDLSDSRKDLGAAIRADELDEEALGALLGRYSANLSELGAKATVAVTRIHEVLDSEQRKRLARLVEGGPFAFAGFR